MFVVGVQMGHDVHDVLCQILNGVQYNKNKMNSKNKKKMMTTARKHHGNQNHWKQQYYLHRRLYPFLPRNIWINLYKNCGVLKRLILKTTTTTKHLNHTR